jgi:hypothetical protein
VREGGGAEWQVCNERVEGSSPTGGVFDPHLREISRVVAAKANV